MIRIHPILIRSVCSDWIRGERDVVVEEVLIVVRLAVAWVDISIRLETNRWKFLQLPSSDFVVAMETLMCEGKLREALCSASKDCWRNMRRGQGPFVVRI